MSRDQLIQQLLLETVHQIVEQGRTTWLLGILEHGFAGYANLGDTDLDVAARRLGVTEEETPVEDTGYADEEEDVAEYTLASRYAGLPGSMIGNWALDTE